MAGRILICTTCSANKRRGEGLLPAIERYLSGRIANVYRESRGRGLPFVIFSGRYGLLDPDSPIGWYDEALEPNRVAPIAQLVARRLEELAVDTLEFYARPRSTPGWAPYFDALQRACASSGTRLVYREIDDQTDEEGGH